MRGKPYETTASLLHAACSHLQRAEHRQRGRDKLSVGGRTGGGACIPRCQHRGIRQLATLRAVGRVGWAALRIGGRGLREGRHRLLQLHIPAALPFDQAIAELLLLSLTVPLPLFLLGLHFPQVLLLPAFPPRRLITRLPVVPLPISMTLLPVSAVFPPPVPPLSPPLATTLRVRAPPPVVVHLPPPIMKLFPIPTIP